MAGRINTTQIRAGNKKDKRLIPTDQHVQQRNKSRSKEDKGILIVSSPLMVFVPAANQQVSKCTRLPEG
jgi:hypothetical protein